MTGDGPEVGSHGPPWTDLPLAGWHHRRWSSRKEAPFDLPDGRPTPPPWSAQDVAAGRAALQVHAPAVVDLVQAVGV